MMRPLSRYCRGDFSGPPEQIHPLAVDSPGPLPSAGRCGGGRVGEPRLACVFRVGFVGTVAGGVLEWAARPVFVLQVVLVPSGGGVLRSATAERLLVRARGSRWPMRAFIPLWISTRRIQLTTPKPLMLIQDGVSSGEEWRLPGVRGPATPPPPGDISRSKASVEMQRRAATGTFFSASATFCRKDLCVISSFLVFLSVILVSI